MSHGFRVQRNVLLFWALSGLSSFCLGADGDPKLFPITEFGPNVPQPGSVRSGFIDETGKVVIPLTSDYMVREPMSWEPTNGEPTSFLYFAEGLQPVTTLRAGPSTWGYVDAKGNFAIGPRFRDAQGFSEGLAPAGSVTGSSWDWGYIDHTGKFVVSPQFDTAPPFSCGRAVVRKNGDWRIGAIDHDGKWVIPPQYPGMGSFHEGLACAAKYVAPRNPSATPGQPTPMIWGFVDTNGAQVIGFKFKYAASFSEGVAAINDDGSCGYIDKTGKYVIPPKFFTGWDFSEGVARVETKDGKIGYTDHTGKVVFTVPGLEWAEPFSEGLAEAEIRAPADHSSTPHWSPLNGRLHGFIDHAGHFVIAPTYWAATSFRNGLAWVVTREEQGYIDKTGTFVWKTKAPKLPDWGD